MFRMTSICLIILFLGLMSSSVTHAETNTYTIRNYGLVNLDKTVTPNFMIIHYIDVDNQQASFDLYKGTLEKYVDGAVLSPGKTWTYQDNDVSVKVYVNSIYKGTTKYSNIVKFTVTSPIETPSKPVASFSATPTSGNTPLKVQFTDKSTNSPTSWEWSFGDGSTSTFQNPAHTYNKAGKYTVSLTAKNTAGANTKTITNYITVKTAPVKPVASFSATPTSGKSPLKVQFTDKSSNVPTSWNWAFGDGTSSTSKNPAHTYSKAGKYTVSLTVKNAAGSGTKTITNYITVNTAPVKPVAAFSGTPTSGNIPLKVQFTDKSTNSPTSWKWDFGDGTTSTTHNPLHTYIKKGTLTVKLTVKNAAGSSSVTKSKYITVK